MFKTDNHEDLYGTTLADLATFPGTADADRYARALRAAVWADDIMAKVEVMDFFEETSQIRRAYELVADAILRRVNRNNTIEQNRVAVAEALDAFCALTGYYFQWRDHETTVDIDGQATFRARYLIGYDSHEVQTGPTWNPCTCQRAPEDFCGAAFHLI